MNKLNEIERLRDEAIERIKEQAKKEIDALTPEFEVGKWYKNIRPQYSKILVHPTKLKEEGGWFECYCFDVNGKWLNPPSDSCNMGDYRLATEEEIKTALINEATKRGFAKNVKIKRGDGFEPNVGIALCDMNINPKYLPEFDRLEFHGCVVYQKGKWAEIIKDEVIKIGGYEVVIHPRAKETTIDGNTFTEHFWKCAREIASHNKACVKVGCSKQFDVSLETINAILAKL